MNASSLIAPLSKIPIDWLVLGTIFIVLVALTLRSGSRVVCSLSLSLPLALFFSQVLPSAFLLGPMSAQFATISAQAALFGLMFLVSLFLSYRIVGPDIGGGASPLQSILVALAGTAIGVVCWLQVPALETFWHVGPLVRSIFAPEYRLWWTVGGLLLLTLARF